MRPRDLEAARQPPVSLPAGRFGPWAEAGALAPLAEPFAEPLASLSARVESGRLDVLCLRPIHHVLEYEALYRLTAALRSRLPGVRLHLHLRSALRDPRPFARLPVDRVERLASRGGRGMLAAGLRRLAGKRGRAAAAAVVLAPPGFQAPGCGGDSGCAAAGAGFLAALFDEVPLWRAAAAAPPPLSRRVAGHRFLIHQARFHVGDTLWITPLLRRIHDLFRRPQVTLVAPPVAAEVLAGNPHLGELLCHHPADGEAGRRRVLAALAGRRFDAALFAFARRHESAWLARAMAGDLAGAGGPATAARRINLEYHDLFQDSRRPWGPFTHEAWFFWGLLPSPRMLLHALDPALPAAARLARRAARSEARLELHPTAAARRRAAELLAARGLEGRHFAVLAPGGHSSPRWPAASFARLAVALAGEMRLAVLIEGSPGEAPLLREVAETVRAAAGDPPPIVVCQDPLDVFAALLERAPVLIGNDSGPLHLAAALGVPSLYFAARERLAHSHPEGTVSWALFDELANDPRRISVEQALGALREMRRQGVLVGGDDDPPAPRATRHGE
ncbi:MAG TPA: glycosyltransferase family 9 protein [Thermoanaerobaculia bacterium]|jgi:ADP-heptose:LPS heptosyltransferase|nr:glycosyltransferase family 9 protein [Thermoanaerobaculia bacterium]